MTRILHLEELEERIAPTIIAAGGSFTFTDPDGDEIRISYFGPEGSFAQALNTADGDLESGDSIGWISVHGNDYTSILLVENLGGGDGMTDIANGIYTQTAGNFGIIALGVDTAGNSAGEVVLGDSAMIAIDNGDLQMLLVNGDLNFDMAGQAHTIVVEGDIGLVEVRGDMYLDPAHGARILASGGDISFIDVAGNIYETSGGPELAPIDVGTGITFADDVGNGDPAVAAMTVRVTAGTGELTLIPIINGGYVLSRLELSPGASAAIAASGGGDVTSVLSSGAIGTVTVSGTADTDVLLVAGDGIGSVINRTIGGDIVAIHSTGDIGTIQTQRLATLGAAFTGPGNSVPSVVLSSLTLSSGIHAAGNISNIRVGGVVNTEISAENLGILTANPGGIGGVQLFVDGAINRIQAASLEHSALYSGEGIGLVRVGASGITSSEIGSMGTIGSIQTTGAISGSLITTKFVDIGGGVFGAGITRLQAGSIFGSQIQSFEGFTNVTVRGIVSESSIETRFADTDLGVNVGGTIGAFNAVGMYNSTVVAQGDISNVVVGTGGMVKESLVSTSGSILRAAVRGDQADHSIIHAGQDIGNVMITGDLAYNAQISADGNINAINIGGALVGSDIFAGGDVGRLSIRSGVTGRHVIIGIGGDLGFFNVSGGFYGVDPAIMDIGGNLGVFNVRGGLARLSLGVGGDVRSLQAAAGGIVQSTIITIGGDLARARIRGTGSSLTVEGEVGNLQLLGDVSGFTASVAGGTGMVNVLGTMTSTSQLLLAGPVGTVNVTGDVNNSSIHVGTDDAGASAGRINIGGTLSSSDIQVWGDLDLVGVRGGMVLSGLHVEGDMSQAMINRGMYGSLVNVEGATDRFTVNTAIQSSATVFKAGVDNYTVRGSIYNANISTTDFDTDGNPIGGAIGRMTATDMTNSNVYAHDGIDFLNVRGTIFGSLIQAAGRDDFGDGDLVDGGGIGTLSARGLNNSSVVAFASIDQIRLMDEGISANSSVATVTGNLGSISTRGIIYGTIDIAGDLTGSISSGGTTAVDLGTDVDRYFTDANGTITGGTLTVGGQVGGPVA